MRPLAALPLFVACAPATPGLRSDVIDAWGGCDAPAIQLAAARHGAQLALEPCGHNRVVHASWSDDGRALLFQLPDTAHVLVVDTGRILTLPVPSPAGPGAWVGPREVALPARGGRAVVFTAAVDPDPTVAAALPQREVQIPRIVRAIAGVREGQLLALLDAEGAPPGAAGEPAWIARANGAVTPLPGAPTDVRTLTWEPDAASLGLGREGLAEVVPLTPDGRLGPPRATFPGAHRAVLSPDGRWVALERPAQPEAQPPQGPSLWVAHLDGPIGSSEPTLLFGLQGDLFAWYRAARLPPGGVTTTPWASWRMWGFDGTPLRPNVVLADLADRLDAAPR
jgi:hypothetical protein